MAGKDKKDGGTDKKGPSYPSLIELIELEQRQEAEARRNEPKSPYPSLIELAQMEEPGEIEKAQSHRTKAGRKPTTPLERIREDKSPKGPQSPDRK